MELSVFNELLNCLKILSDSTVDFPDHGSQKSYDVYRKQTNSNDFELIINRKGHLRTDTLTYLIFEQSEGMLVRLDFAGAPHDEVPTPHVHIFNEEYDNGRKAIPLDEISDYEIINELKDSLTAFLLYNNVELDGIDIGLL